MSDCSLLRRRLLGLAVALPAAESGAGTLRRLFTGWDDEADVIVAGAGAAGLSAAVEAAGCGARVLLIEKCARPGGDTLISGGYFAAPDPARQRRQGIEDSEEQYFRDVWELGGRAADPALVRVLTSRAADALHWLESLGLRFQDRVVQIYGSHWPRCHKPVLPGGTGYIRTLVSEALRRGVRLETETALEGFIVSAGRVTGIRAVHEGRVRTIRAKRAVVLATGGFGRNPRMVARWAPSLAGLTADCAPGTTGEGIEAAETAGAALRDMAFIQCLPGCPPGRTHRVRLHNDASRFILVNARGRRFIAEDERRDRLQEAVLALPEKYAWAVTDQESLDGYNIIFRREAVEGIETGDAWSADTLEELARQAGLPPDALAETVRNYNAAVRAGRDPLGKKPSELTKEILHPPYWACYAGMTVHYTMGGVAVSPNAEALRSDGTPLPGLFAAGAAAGGVHGRNRLGGSGLADAVVFGRIAGAGAARSSGKPAE